jgi:hypothetical protein
MVTHDRAFSCDGLGALMKLIKKGEYKPLNEDTSESLKDLISNMLKLDAD